MLCHLNVKGWNVRVLLILADGMLGHADIRIAILSHWNVRAAKLGHTGLVNELG
jgi:hypothetical protein